MLKFVSSLATLAFLASAGAGFAAGTAVGVDPDAEARGNGTRTLVVGSDIFIGDRVVTDARGLVQILFDDKTKLVVGPRSSLVIEDYLIRNDGSAGRLAVNALSGTFRFITGNSPKNRYVIKTPTGQIGVRGTVFDLRVLARLALVLHLEGRTINCSNNGDCETMSRRCDIAAIGRNGTEDYGSSRDFSRDEIEDARGWFTFATSQSDLLRPFRVSNAEQCMRPRRGGNGPGVTLEFELPGGSLADPNILRRNDNNDSYD